MFSFMAQKKLSRSQQKRLRLKGSEDTTLRAAAYGRLSMMVDDTTSPQRQRLINEKLIQERGYVYDRTCFYLYRSMSIYPGGGVTPCCFTHDRKDDFGDINSGSIMEIWNNRHFRSARMLFNDKPPAEERIQVVCDECPIYRQPGKAACTAHTSPLQVPSAVEPVARLEVHRRSGTEARRPSHSPHGRDEDTFTPAPPTTRC